MYVRLKQAMVYEAFQDTHSRIGTQLVPGGGLG